MFDQRRIDLTRLKYLKVNKKSKNTDITKLDNIIEACSSFGCLQLECSNDDADLYRRSTRATSSDHMKEEQNKDVVRALLKDRK
jgi:hypothetical protein